MSGTTYDLVLTDGKLVFEHGVVEGGLAVAGGQIARLLGPGEVPPADQVRRVNGRYILPGLIDSHVHFRTPGLTFKETWVHGSRAAAAGGVTTVIDMPNTAPPLLDPTLIVAKAEMIGGQSLVDYAFHIGAAPGRTHLLRHLQPQSVASIKVFLAGHHTAHQVITNPGDLDAVFALAASRNILVTLHAEDEGVFRYTRSHRPAPATLADYEQFLPRSAGIVAVARALEVARKHGTRVHVLHVSSAEEVDLLEAAARTLPVTFEVTPHHLALNAEDCESLGTKAKISPALRRRGDAERLWEAVRAGSVTTLGSDHAPHTREEKARPFPDAPPGLPGVQELFPVTLTGLSQRYAEMPVADRLCLLVRLCAGAPARLFGLDHRKGSLTPGLDADMCIVDPDEVEPYGAERIQSLCGWSPYEGWRLAGMPLITIRRGQVIYDDGRFGRPDGRWLGQVE